MTKDFAEEPRCPHGLDYSRAQGAKRQRTGHPSLVGVRKMQAANRASGLFPVPTWNRSSVTAARSGWYSTKV